MSDTERHATLDFAEYLKTKDSDYIENILNRQTKNQLIEYGLLKKEKGERIVDTENFTIPD